MGKKVNGNIYLEELKTKLATIKASLLANEEASFHQLKKLRIDLKSAKYLCKDKKKHHSKSFEYFKSVSLFSNNSEQAKQFVNRVADLARIVSSDEQLVTNNMSIANKSIEAALESILIVSASTAAMHAITTSESTYSRISKLTTTANEIGQETIKTAEKCAAHALNANILAAQSASGILSIHIPALEKETEKLFSALDTMMQTAKLNMEQANTDYQSTVEVLVNTELSFEKVKLDYKSAKQANSLVQ
jgi:hypothetical protein